MIKICSEAGHAGRASVLESRYSLPGGQEAERKGKMNPE